MVCVFHLSSMLKSSSINSRNCSCVHFVLEENKSSLLWDTRSAVHFAHESVIAAVVLVLILCRDIKQEQKITTLEEQKRFLWVFFLIWLNSPAMKNCEEFLKRKTISLWCQKAACVIISWRIPAFVEDIGERRDFSCDKATGGNFIFLSFPTCITQIQPARDNLHQLAALKS